ncbi:hypothetical protein CMI47_12445 [Candidatus Pacearchaeota archaeon]|nr:hypothetical protein [Candidatus Pacearchaeota archaeon]
MESPTRLEVTVEITWVIFRGRIVSGINLYGPFRTFDEAVEYGEKHFPEDTREFVQMTKETITHGEET